MNAWFYSKHLERIAPPPSEKCVWSEKQHVRLAIVMPEPRAHPWMRPVLNAAAHVYGGDPTVSLVLMHGTENEGFARETVAGWSGVRFVNLGVPDLNIDEYNKLLTGAAFYTNLDAEFVLILQTDALLRKRIPEVFFDRFDYMGAPWFYPWSQTGTCVGNGGFSLRRCAAMAAICAARDGPACDCNEDVYFSERVHAARQPSADLAGSFSVELIRHSDPVGIHKAYEYHDADYIVGLVSTTPGYAAATDLTEEDAQTMARVRVSLNAAHARKMMRRRYAPLLFS